MKQHWIGSGGPFSDLEFSKSGAEIKAKAEEKLGTLKHKLEEREMVIQDLTKNMGLETAMDVLIRLDQLEELMSNAVADSPEKAKLHQAVARLRDYREEMNKLALVIRNIDIDGSFALSFDALEYYGF